MEIKLNESNGAKIYTDETKEYEFAIEKNENGNRILAINNDNIDKLSSDQIYKLLYGIYYRAAKDGVKLIIETTKQLPIVQIQSEETLVKNIEPIRFDGEIDINDEIAPYMCIEAPVRSACMSLNEMGITTLMSSANKVDVEYRNQKIGFLKNSSGEHFNIGNGYAWIMLDWESLSQDNKQKLIMLNNGTIHIELSANEKANLIHNCEINNYTVSQKELISFFQVVSENFARTNSRDALTLEVNSDEDDYYEKNRRGYMCNNSLCNHGDNYRTVVIRYPLDESTTISQVNNYFTNIIKHLNTQRKLDYSADSGKRGS